MSITTSFDRLSGKEQQIIIKTLREIKEARKNDPGKNLFEKPKELRKIALNYLMKHLEEEFGKGTIILQPES